MRSLSLLLLAGALVLGVSPIKGEAALSPRAYKALQMLEGVDEDMEKAIRDYKVPGIAVGVVVDGELIFAKGYGYRDVEQRLPVTPSTIFAAGSLTKAFTSFLVGNLVDEGVLSWDVPVVEYIPDFRLWNEYATRNVTPRDLVSHRTGLARHDFMWYNSGMSRNEVMKRLRYLEPACDLRERYNYNNLMYLVAGVVMEKATGKTWEELITERILRPLGMKNTTCSVSDLARSSDVSYPYFEKGGKIKRMGYRDIHPLEPAGGLNSNIYDLAEWVKLNLGTGTRDGKTFVTQATLQEMQAAQMIVSGYAERPDTLLNAYGLGWMVQSHRGYYNIGHHGGLDGFTSFISLLPHEGIGVIILSNKNLSPLPYILTLYFLDRALGIPGGNWIEQGLSSTQTDRGKVGEQQKRENQLRKKGTHPSHELVEYVGEYVNPGYGTLRVELADGKLRATLHGLTMVLDHWHYDVFNVEEEIQDSYFPRVGTKYSFRNDARGDVSEVSVPFEPNVGDIVFKKKPDGRHATFAYLLQFVGPYEIYDMTVEVVLRGDTLYAVIPGQPLFELVPNGQNEFTVKSMAGFTVRFLLNEENRVDEVLLIQPYGALSAKPKR